LLNYDKGDYMWDKMKFVFIGLGAGIIILILLFLQAGQDLVKVKTERDNLKESSSNFNAQLSNLNKENEQIKREFNNAKSAFERVEAEKSEAADFLKSVIKERDNLKINVGQLNVELAEARRNVSQVVEVKKKVEEKVEPVSDAYWGSILKKKAELELGLEKLREELQTAKSENGQLKREKDKLNLDLQSYELEQKDSVREFEYNEKLIDNLTTELAREKTDKFRTQEILQVLKKENKVLKQQLKTINERRMKLEEKFSELREKNAALESSMAKLEVFVKEKIVQVNSLKNDLGARVDSLKDDIGAMLPIQDSGTQEDSSVNKKGAIELAPIVVRPQEEDNLKTKRTKTGSVIALNKDNNFLILNIGSGSGVKVGDTFQIFRKDKRVALVKVIQVRESISACDIKNQNTPLIIGDSAKLIP